MQFVIFHGSYGSSEGNWYPQLKEQLENLGQEVLVPQFPVDSWNNVVEQGEDYTSPIQNLENWFKTFEEKVLPWLKKDEKVCFIGHSLGPVFILHAVEKYNIQLDSAIFVSPFFAPLGKWEFNVVNDTFHKSDFDFDKLKKLIPLSYVLYSDNDPYVPQNQPKEFAEKLGSSLIPVRRAGHINSEVNLNEFPLVFDLCTTRLDLSLWQQYLAHRKQLFGIDFIRQRPESMALFKPEEIFDWSIFLYEHLKKKGFCTFYTGIASWDGKSAYYESARHAAKRIDSFVRVFLVEQLSDLHKPALREQISMDIEAEIQVNLCMLSQVQPKIGEVDFGLWDDEYLCIVKIDDEKKAVAVEINTKHSDIEEAITWREAILKHAEKISNATSDIDNFISTHSDSVIYLDPSEIADEGIFKFRHLKTNGFATLYVSAGDGKFWDSQSKYMEESRQAAKRVKNITRVYIAKTPEDFSNANIMKQIQLDLNAGIHIYAALENDIKNYIQTTPDFGIWDNEYVCFVELGENSHVLRAKLSSLKDDIEKANTWKEKIIEKAKPVNTLQDIT